MEKTCKKELYTLLMILCSFGLFAQKGELLFDNAYVHEIRIDFYGDQYWDELTTNYEDYAQFSGSDIPYVPASISIDGVALDSVGIRFKGKSAYYYVGDKKPIKIDINEFISGQEFDGLRKINLHNGLGDPGMQRNLLSYDLMRKMGVAAPRVSYCKLYLNGEYWGVYDVIEQIDRTFLDNHFADDSGNLFKNQRWSELKWFGDNPDAYRDTFELKTNTDEDDWTAFINFLDVLNHTSDEDFSQAIQEVFHVDGYLHVLAVDILTNNWDSYIDNARNFYLYHEPESGLFHWIPWDYNLAMGGRISLSGNPYPPFDLDCIIRTDFGFSKDGLDAHFTEYTEPAADGYLWDFGDGTTSSEQSPVHSYAEAGVYEVCLSVYLLEDIDLCEQKRCIEIDMTFDPGQCNTIQNGSSPYEASDPIFQQVIAEDDFCCNNQWDAACQFLYIDLQNNQSIPEISSGNDYDTNYNIFLNNPDKILIDRILAVPEFRERYLDIICRLEGTHFSFSSLYPKIEYFGDLLRDAIHDDPNYLYTHDYFEYDVGNGTGGGSEAKIPSLKYFFIHRIPHIQDDLAATQHDCSDAFTNLVWNDLVINEFVASADEQGYADSNGDFDDWIELYNNTSDTIYLDHFYLSDEIANPFKWSFPSDARIAPLDFLIVWADKDLSQGSLHTNFKLSKSGEEIILFHEDGTLMDYLTFETQLTNLASARIPNGTGEFVLQEITPGENNELINSNSNIGQQDRITISPNPTNDLIQIELQSSAFPENWHLRIINTLGETVFSSQNNSQLRKNVSLKELNIPSGIYFIEVDLNRSKQLKKLLFIN